MILRVSVVLAFLAAVFGFVLLPANSYAAGNKYADSKTEPTIRIGIWANQPNLIISADTEFQIVNEDTNDVLGQYNAKEKVNFAFRDSQILLNGKITQVKNIKIVQKKGDNHYIEVNRRTYRGDIVIHQTSAKSGFTVINTLPLEEYLYGVVAEEISPDWPTEAVKAQAVAARTYALSNLHKHEQSGYDLCATTDCQVYGGVSSESARTTKAVDDTRGQVLLYQGKPISAVYHSSSGGYTENSENVWGTYVPYLRGVQDYDTDASNHQWEKQIKPAELSQALQRAGYSLGNVTAIILSPRKQAPMDAADRGVSGRVKSATFIGTNSTITIPGSKIRSILSLNSTNFDIKTIVPIDKSIDVKITDSYGDREQKQIPVNLPPQAEKTFLNNKEDLHRLTGRTGELIVITGFGQGHGLGMSQWGAKAMADTAPAGDATYFKQILKHYYQYTEVKKVY